MRDFHLHDDRVYELAQNAALTGNIDPLLEFLDQIALSKVKAIDARRNRLAVMFPREGVAPSSGKEDHERGTRPPHHRSGRSVLETSLSTAATIEAVRTAMGERAPAAKAIQDAIRRAGGRRR